MMTLPSIRKQEIIFCLFAAFAIALIYTQVSHHEFVNYDDDVYLTLNQHVQGGLTKEGVQWAFSFRDKQTYWHPLTWLSHMADVSLFGMAPGWHLLVNMLWHVLNTWLLFFLLNRMTGLFWPSAFTAALFAVHPVNVEVVAWVAQRKSLVSTFFCFLSMGAYAFYARSPNYTRYLLLIGIFIAGLMAKPMLITLPFVFLLLDYWPLQRILPGTGIEANEQGSFREKWKNSRLLQCILEKIPLVLISLLTTYTVTRSFPAGKYVSYELVPLSLRVENLVVSYTVYLGKLLWPVDLAVLYPYPKSLSLLAVLAGLGLLVVFSLLTVTLLRRQRFVAVGWLWFLGTILPVSGLIQAGLWPAIADRWLYIPAIGIFLILAGLLTALTSRPEKSGTWSAAALVCLTVVLGSLSWLQVRYWQNSISLFTHTADVTRDNVIAYTNLGQALWTRGRYPEALDAYRTALRIFPKSAKIHYSIGRVMTDMGNCREARPSFMQAAALNPGYARGFNDLGSCYAKNGLYSDARWAFEQTLRYYPADAEAKSNLNTVTILGRGSQ